MVPALWDEFLWSTSLETTKSDEFSGQTVNYSFYTFEYSPILKLYKNIKHGHIKYTKKSAPPLCGHKSLSPFASSGFTVYNPSGQLMGAIVLLSG